MSENFFTLNRQALSPQASMKSLASYAIEADARMRLRRRNLTRASLATTLLTFGPPFAIFFYGTIFGVNTQLSETYPMFAAFHTVSQGYRRVYRPEIFLRDQSDLLYQKEKELKKAGQPGLGLWH